MQVIDEENFSLVFKLSNEGHNNFCASSLPTHDELNQINSEIFPLEREAS